MIKARIVGNLEALERYTPEWDALAVAAARPYCAPGWLLPWWRRASPPGARLQVVVVHAGDDVVGVAPFYAQSLPGGLEQLRLLGACHSSPVEPLAAPGQVHPVAAAIATELDNDRPRPAVVAFEGVCTSPGWPQLLAGAWPGRLPPRLRVLQTIPAPTVSLDFGGYEAWLGSKSRNFRQQMRRMRRQLAAAGADLRRIAAPDELRRFRPWA